MSQCRPEPGASLDHLSINSSDPERLARFFESHYGMRVGLNGSYWQCEAMGRTVLTSAGSPNSVGFIAFGFSSQSELAGYLDSLTKRHVPIEANASPIFDSGAFSVVDPDGNRVVFGMRSKPGGSKEARLQHVAFRTTNIAAMLDFYSISLGFSVSDLVKDGEGGLRACFLRSDQEHHALALFAAPVCRLDHHSYETGDITSLTGWADRVTAAGTPIHWGVGRHGPGNDVFFMVKDPDDNLVEISTDLEQCSADRVTGTWKHEQKTLNLWGTALMRS